MIVHGSVGGNIFASEKIEIRKTGHVVGDLLAASVAIEEGATEVRLGTAIFGSRTAK